jgi:hypothetical protein
MSSHVPAIGQQGHGAENVTGRNFYDHHRKGQDNNPSRIAFGLIVFNVEAMVVLPEVQVVNVHGVINSRFSIWLQF